jgi:hypothetical protein
MARGLLIPVTGPVVEVEVDDTLECLQALIGGFVEANPLPRFVDRHNRATCYVHADGKNRFEPNMRATDFLVPGVGLFMGDYVAGPLLLCGFDPHARLHADLPDVVVQRARLIEDEAG